MKVLSLHITDLCNSACGFCVVASPLHTSNTVEYETVIDFLRSNAGSGFAAVNLHGGEPTVHPKFLEILDEIRRLGYPQVHLQTNAVQLYRASYTDTLINAGVSKFIVSLHGHTASLQDSLTHTPGGFAKTIEGIRNIVSRGVHVRTNTVILNANVAFLKDICELACDLAVSHINLSALHPVGSALFSRSADMPRYSEMYEEVMRATDIVLRRKRGLTLEGFPYCTIMERLPWQLTEEPRSIKMLTSTGVVQDYDLFMASKMRVLGSPCVDCAVKHECGGAYPQYVQFNGWSEFHAINQVERSGAAAPTR